MARARRDLSPEEMAKQSAEEKRQRQAMLAGLGPRPILTPAGKAKAAGKKKPVGGKQPAGPEKLPATGIRQMTYSEAVQAFKWQHGRLPTAAEMTSLGYTGGATMPPDRPPSPLEGPGRLIPTPPPTPTRPTEPRGGAPLRPPRTRPERPAGTPPTERPRLRSRRRGR